MGTIYQVTKHGKQVWCVDVMSGFTRHRRFFRWRSGFYYEPVPESPENLALMRRLDRLHLEHPCYGSRRLTALLQREGQVVNRKRVVRLLGLMGVEVCYPKRRLSQPGEGRRIYPYLLEGLEISGPDQVWCSDIT